MEWKVLWKSSIFPSIMKDSFDGYTNLGGTYFLLGLEHIIPCPLCFWVSVDKSAVILMGLFLYVTRCFSLAAFSILSLFCILSVLTISWCGQVLFCSCLFDVLKASYTWIIVSSPRFRKFSNINLWNMFFMLLACTSSSVHWFIGVVFYSVPKVLYVLLLLSFSFFIITFQMF
jgi:hypothetical protein